MSVYDYDPDTGALRDADHDALQAEVSIEYPEGLLTGIMAFEQGELDEDGMAKLFQHLVDTGLAWRLQGTYGRTAMDLIEAGLVTPPAAAEEA